MGSQRVVSVVGDNLGVSRAFRRSVWSLGPELGFRNVPRALNCAPAPVAQLDRAPGFESSPCDVAFRGRKSQNVATPQFTSIRLCFRDE